MSGIKAQEAAAGSEVDGEATAAEADPVDSAESEAGAGEAGSGEVGDDIPVDVLKRDLKNTRREAASYRTQLRELQEKTKEYKTVEEFNEAMADVNSKLAAKDRELIAESYRIPENYRKFIIGENAEEWEAAAKELSEGLNKPEPDPTPPPTQTPPSGSRKKSAAASTDTPADAAARALSRR